MDQRQKELVSKLAAEAADSMRAIDFAKCLIDAGLISQNQWEEIEDTADSNYVRNLRLFDAVQDSTLTNAFDNLMRVLDKLEQSSQKRILGANIPQSKQQQNQSHKSILSKLFNKFGKSSPPNYPLGMNSGNQTLLAYPGSSTSRYTSASYDDGRSQCGINSPLKERHQATVVTGLNDESSSNSASQFRLARRQPDGQIPVGLSNAMQTGARLNDRSSDIGHNHTRNSRLNQPRLSELGLLNNLSIVESDFDENISAQGDPLMVWHPYEQASSGAGSRSASPHRCLPSYSSASSESSESTSDSVIVDPNLMLDPNVMTAIAREGTNNTMSVKLANVCHNNPEEDYKMTARPRGKCLIVNNIEFEADIFPMRKGSDEDANRFDVIFKQLGFETIMTRNLTADQMRSKFRELSAACKPEHDALFVFILSHGSEHGIYGTDGIEVYLESEIISCFDNRNCKVMIGKPKVFVIQACRGRSKDCGGDGDTTDSIAWSSVAVSPPVMSSASQEHRVPNSWLPSQPSNGKKPKKHPIRTDMLLVFSCLAGKYFSKLQSTNITCLLCRTTDFNTKFYQPFLSLSHLPRLPQLAFTMPGFVSVRNETAGSWLGVALAYFIMTHAHERDLLRILNLVTSDIIQRESSNGHIQSIELKLLGWTKNLYFNPGIHL